MNNRTKRLLSILLAIGLFCSMGGVAAATSQEGEEVMPAAEVSASMSYHNNSVTLQGSGGIQITNGTFEVNELSITSGQDPDGKNYVGQVHILSNGQFSFEVGRKGSEAVASWFNARLSGFNDDSVNGDRTTFDHTAGTLNFAFIGDLTLSLTGQGFTQGITVTFPDVAFAQGKSGLSNNWWFGQKQGQHTRDSDGPNRVLVFGTDGSGSTVFASFLRGGNSVNAVSLEALYVPGAAADRAMAVPDVQDAFAALPVNGSLTTLQGFSGNYDAVSCHVQGYTQYENAVGTRYSLLTHSVSSASYAHIVAGTKNGSDK